MRNLRINAPLLALAVLTAAVLGAPTAASAHDSLTAGVPGAGETVTAQPGSVRLTYSGTLLDVSGTGESFALRVVGPDGLYYERGCPVLVDNTSEAAVDLGQAGEYTVQWQVVSSDGHPVSDAFTFDYAPAADQPVAAGAAEPFPCGIAATDDSATGSTPDVAEDDAPVSDTDGASDAPVEGQETGAAEDDGTGIAIAAGVAGVTLVAVLGIVLLARRRRTASDD